VGSLSSNTTKPEGPSANCIQLTPGTEICIRLTLRVRSIHTHYQSRLGTLLQKMRCDANSTPSMCQEPLVDLRRMSNAIANFSIIASPQRLGRHSHIDVCSAGPCHEVPTGASSSHYIKSSNPYTKHLGQDDVFSPLCPPPHSCPGNFTTLQAPL
jgi:hypothetical protein